jgi:hypothetical protein
MLLLLIVCEIMCLTNTAPLHTQAAVQQQLSDLQSLWQPLLCWLPCSCCTSLLHMLQCRHINPIAAPRAAGAFSTAGQGDEIDGWCHASLLLPEVHQAA